jgi:hypothetical protein
MAEAAAGARLDAALLSVRDVMIFASEDGTYSITFSFNPWRFRKQLIRSIFSLRLTLENTVWPLTPGIWGSVCAATALKVLTSRKDSWWRSGWLANALWSWDSCFPWQNLLPTEVRLDLHLLYNSWSHTTNPCFLFVAGSHGSRFLLGP